MPSNATNSAAPKPMTTNANVAVTSKNPPANTTVASELNNNPTDQAVLDYLRRKGMGTAVLQLQDMLQEETETVVADPVTAAAISAAANASNTVNTASVTNTANTASVTATPRERLELLESSTRNQRTLLTKSTGGGFGYDRDATWQVVQWGIPDTSDNDLTGDYDGDGGTTKMGVPEAKSYLQAFCALQLWVTSLPDTNNNGNDANNNNNALGSVSSVNPLAAAAALVRQADNGDKSVGVHNVVAALVQPTRTGNNNDTTTTTTTAFNLPPCCKSELLSVTFALLVHTYCELLEVGMESTAHTLRDAFGPVYKPLYPDEFRDLVACATTEDIMRLNTHNSQHMEALNTLKQYLVQTAAYQLRREELNNNNNNNAQQLVDPAQVLAREQKKVEYDRNIGLLKQKYSELSTRVTAMFHKLNHLPFLRRARAVRWQLHMSNATYGLLSSFLNARDDALLAMSALLQTKCELHVERRDPLPFVPACVFEEAGIISKKSKPQLELNQVPVQWAAPAVQAENKNETELPYPKFHLEKEYPDERAARRGKRSVEFNRALVVNGFRRLEALERKREYETMPAAAQKVAKEGYHQSASSRAAVNPLEPSILLMTLCSSTAGPILRPLPSSLGAVRSNFTDAASIWEESGIGLCCAKVCPPDGRRVAVGCDDSAVRVWNANDGGDPTQVLLGHKNGFPVFDVDWNRDGRTLLSGGGDGTVRLWDTMAVGPFGEVTTPKPSTPATKAAAAAAKDAQPSINASTTGSDMTVPGMRPENAPYSSGAALAVYRGHAPSSPVWSVSFAPSGYYFASAGGDSTARLWATDRPVPVRLFTGHSASNVNCVEWHPNCNYIVTGSDDKTVRLWDIQTGQTVRLLNGCNAGINAVKISPGGRYAAGADYSGVIHLWDLGTGKKVTEFRTQQPQQETSQVGLGMIHALNFSNCGTSLASGGDDGTVRIWDVRADSLLNKPLVTTPTKSFGTRRTLIMDLSYTKRNLLLSVGKVVTPVPLAPGAPTVSD